MTPISWQALWAGSAERRQERPVGIDEWRAPAPGYGNSERAGLPPPLPLPPQAGSYASSPVRH